MPFSGRTLLTRRDTAAGVVLITMRAGALPAHGIGGS